LSLPLLRAGHSLKFAFLPEGQDPDDLLKAQGPEALRAVVAAAEPMAEVLWRRALDENDRATPERKAAFERDLKGLINTISDETVKKHYLADLQDRLARLFGREPARQRFQPAAAQGQRAKWGQRPWDARLPVSARLKALASTPSGLNEAGRRAQLILLGLINHPALLHEFWADFSGLDLPGAELDSVRTLILEAAAAEEHLERGALQAHLLGKGFGPILGRLDAQARHLNEWHLSPAAAADDARTGLRQMFALHHKTIVLTRELKAAEAALALDMSAENEALLHALQQQLQSLDGREASVAGFGAASGRKASGDF
jgi:DNA primase